MALTKKWLPSFTFSKTIDQFNATKSINSTSMSTFFHTSNPSFAPLSSCRSCGQRFASQALLDCHLLQDHSHHHNPGQQQQTVHPPVGPLSPLSLPPLASLPVTGSASAHSLAPLVLTRASRHGSGGDNPNNTATHLGTQHFSAVESTSNRTIFGTLTSMAPKTRACLVCDECYQVFRSEDKLEAHTIKVHHRLSRQLAVSDRTSPFPSLCHPSVPSEGAGLSSKLKKATAHHKVKEQVHRLLSKALHSVHAFENGHGMCTSE